jgi:transcriptional regulator PpsR
MEAAVSARRPGEFAAAETWLGNLDASAAAKLIGVAADVAFLLDRDGVIRDLAFTEEDAGEPIGRREWVGRPWVETVTIESKSKVEQLLQDAAEQRAPAWREINQTSSEGRDIPIRCSAVALGPDGPVVALGRDLRPTWTLQQRLVEAQRAMEREYSRLRNTETRYRLLFQLVSEPILIVEVASGRIAEANPAAGRLTGNPAQKLPGRAVTELFEPESAAVVQSLVNKAGMVGRADDTIVRLADGETSIRLGISLFRHEGTAHLLMRLSHPDAEPAADPAQVRRAQAYEIAMGMPEALVIVDDAQRVLDANASFLELVELGSLEQARGQPLDRWLGRPGVDVRILATNLREHGSLRDFATIVRGEYGGHDEVEVTAVAVPHQQQPCAGLILRTVGRRPAAQESDGGETRLPSVAHITERVGRVPLKELVRETSDMIEQLCIEAALKLTSDNRASAAQILGLSRQSLYAKLRRYGIGDIEDDGADDAEA